MSSSSKLIFLHETKHTSAQPSDAELISQGFNAVYHAYVKYVATIAHRLLGRADEVEDLVQDVFLEVHRTLHHLKEPEALRGWLGTVTTRIAIKKLKRRRLKRFVGFDDVAHRPEIHAPGASAAQRALLMQVFHRLDELPTMWRVVWCLRHLEGKNNSEVATLCDCSVTTVKRHYAQASQLLKEMFDES